MAKSILDIVIRTLKQGGADKETIKGLVGVKDAATSTMGTLAALTGIAFTVEKAFTATVGAFINYAKEVRNLSEISGASAEDTSKLIQVAGDFFITTEQLTAATKALTKNGLSPTISTLAALSDEYVAIQDPVERAAFLTENFGKAGLKMATMMATGGDALQKMADGTEKNLVLTQKAIDDAREYELAVEDLKGAWEDFTIGVGQKAVPTLTSILDNVNLNIAAQNSYDEALQKTNGNWRAANSLAYKMAQEERGATEATLAHADAMEVASEASEVLAVDYEKLIPSIMNMQNETDRYNETLQEIKKANAQAKADYASGNISLEERNGILEENRAKLAENAAAHNEWAAQTVFAFAQARAAADGNITEGEGQMLIEIGQQLGLFDQQTAQAMQSVNQAFSTVDTSNAQATVDALNDSLQALTGRDWNIVITTTTVGSIPTDPTGSGIPGSGYATGGAFDAGAPMLVHQDEVMVPDYGGVVLTRTDAMRLLSGQGGANNSKRINIYGLTINAQGSVMDELDALK